MQLSRRQLDKLLYKLSYLGAGSQGSCYVDKSNDLVYKVFHTYTEKENSDLPFSDISKDSWDWKYWNYAYCNSVISGFEDGTARPNDNVTYAQFVKMLVTSKK